MNDTLAVQVEELARLATLLRTGLTESEATMPVINDQLAELADVGITDFEFEGPIIYYRVAGISGAYCDDRVLYAAALVMPGGVGATCWTSADYENRFWDSPQVQPSLRERFLAYPKCPSVVRALLPRHAGVLVTSLLRDFKVLAP
jgi:hypothetical protein